MTEVSVQTTDVVNAVLGVEDGSPIVQLRNRKPEIVAQLQAYYDALFNPVAESAQELAVADRLVIAVRVASHTGSDAIVSWYEARAIEAGVPKATIGMAKDTATAWDGDTALDAAIRHADLLTTRPVDARREDLVALKDAGFTPAGILSLSQVVAYVSYQLRLVAGLRAVGDLA